MRTPLNMDEDTPQPHTVKTKNTGDRRSKCAVFKRILMTQDAPVLCYRREEHEPAGEASVCDPFSH
jgi:hypothetical protein